MGLDSGRPGNRVVELIHGYNGIAIASALLIFRCSPLVNRDKTVLGLFEHRQRRSAMLEIW